MYITGKRYYDKYNFNEIKVEQRTQSLHAEEASVCFCRNLQRNDLFIGTRFKY